MLTNHEAFNKAKQCQKIAVGSIYKVFFFFFFEIKIEILFDKREIHVQTQQPCKHKYKGTKTCSAENKICNKINTAHGHRIQKQQ